MTKNEFYRTKRWDWVVILMGGWAKLGRVVRKTKEGLVIRYQTWRKRDREVWRKYESVHSFLGAEDDEPF